MAYTFKTENNVVACLDKFEGNQEYHGMIDFLLHCPITYAITVNPTIFKTPIEEFWETAVVDGAAINAVVNQKAIHIDAKKIRTAMQFNDDKGTTSFPISEVKQTLLDIGYSGDITNATVFKKYFAPKWRFLVEVILKCLSRKTSAWDQVPSNVQTLIHALVRGLNFNYSRYILENLGELVSETKDSKQFAIYPRFVTLLIRQELGADFQQTGSIFFTRVQTRKVFSYMKSHNVISEGPALLLTMLRPQPAQRVELQANPADQQPTTPHHTSPQMVPTSPLDQGLTPSQVNFQEFAKRLSSTRQEHEAHAQFKRRKKVVTSSPPASASNPIQTAQGTSQQVHVSHIREATSLAAPTFEDAFIEESQYPRTDLPSTPLASQTVELDIDFDHDITGSVHVDDSQSSTASFHDDIDQVNPGQEEDRTLDYNSNLLCEVAGTTLSSPYMTKDSFLCTKTISKATCDEGAIPELGKPLPQETRGNEPLDSFTTATSRGPSETNIQSFDELTAMVDTLFKSFDGLRYEVLGIKDAITKMTESNTNITSLLQHILSAQQTQTQSETSFLPTQLVQTSSTSIPNNQTLLNNALLAQAISFPDIVKTFFAAVTTSIESLHHTIISNHLELRKEQKWTRQHLESKAGRAAPPVYGDDTREERENNGKL